jgi:hypothetical protein
MLCRTLMEISSYYSIPLYMRYSTKIEAPLLLSIITLIYIYNSHEVAKGKLFAIKVSAGICIYLYYKITTKILYVYTPYSQILLTPP